MENKEIDNIEEIKEEIKPVKKQRNKKAVIVTQEVKQPEPEPEQESDNEIQAPKPKRILSERQKETLQRGRQIRDELRRQRAEQKAQEQEQQKKVLEEKIVKKAIRIKKKQIKQEQILEPTESETEAEEEIKAPPKPILRRERATYKPRETQEIQPRAEQASYNSQREVQPEPPKRKIIFL